jgi:hypothetical protein
MSEETKNGEAPNVIIPLEHQSAPKEHWMNRELRKAAEDIDAGGFTPELKDDDYFYIGPEQLLWQHPRIIEALELLKTEVSESKNTEEYIEKSLMLHELNEMAMSKDRWDGQGRWLGKENEAERYGELLTPAQFMTRLEAVIGRGRVSLFRYAVMGRVAVLIDNPNKTNLFVPGPYTTGDKLQVATLQFPLGTEWMQMKFTEYGVPKYARFLGWRTALLSLIAQEVITETEAHKAFPVHERTASKWYLQQLYELRNGRGQA